VANKIAGVVLEAKLVVNLLHSASVNVESYSSLATSYPAIVTQIFYSPW
jgi:hypothetical protein